MVNNNRRFPEGVIKMSRLIALIISSMIVITGASAAYGAEYADVKTSNWAYDAINTMSDKSIIIGYPDGSFKPNNTVTYGEFIKMALIAATGEDAGNAASGHWAQNYYDKALEMGYFTEYDIERSMLGDKITRAHMALIISSILGDVEIADYDEIQKGISDITYKTKYEYDITKVYACGILTGYPDKTFKPEQTLSRAESAMVIYRLVDEGQRIYPRKETESGKRIDILVGNKTYVVTSHDVQLGYNGVEKIEVNKLNRIVIYSTVCYDAVRVYIDNVQVSAMGFTNGLDYYQEGKYYIYLANAARDNIRTSGTTPTLMFSNDIENVYRYIDVTL
jgi:hypothetical protein